MESIFNENSHEVGAEIEAYCPSSRCKADTTHAIVSMYEDEIRRVQCLVCNEVHAFRKPKGDDEDEQEIDTTPLRKRLLKKPAWEEAMRQVTDSDLETARPYSILDRFEQLDIIAHPKFGIGFVTELLKDNKVEITFKDIRRTLIHNRSDLARKVSGKLASIPGPEKHKKSGEKESDRRQKFLLTMLSISFLSPLTQNQSKRL